MVEGPFDEENKPTKPAKTTGGLSEAPGVPHYHGHRDRLRERFGSAGADSLSRLRTFGIAALPFHTPCRYQTSCQKPAR